MNWIIAKFPLLQEHLDMLRKIAAIRGCTTGDVVRAAIETELFLTEAVLDGHVVQLFHKRRQEYTEIENDWLGDGE